MAAENAAGASAETRMRLEYRMQPRNHRFLIKLRRLFRALESDGCPLQRGLVVPADVPSVAPAHSGAPAAPARLATTL